MNSEEHKRHGGEKKSPVKAPLVLVGLLCLMGMIVYKDYLLFKQVFFFVGVGSDSLNYNYPFMYNVAAYMAEHGLPSWSFNFGLGQSLFPFFLRDPFDIILYLAGKKHIYHGMAYIEFTKIVLSGLIFYYYLKTLKYSDYTAITGSLLYAFCGFMVVGGCWYIFSFEAFNMAVLLLAFELLFTRGKWLLFPIAIALMAISQPFNIYIYGLFLACYALLRHAQTDTFTAANTGSTFLKMAGLGITGLCLGGPFLLENVAQMLGSPRGNGVNSYYHILSSTPVFSFVDIGELGTCVMRLFSNDLLGRGEAYYGWHNYLEAPLFYCGLPCLLLMPQVFTFLDKRLKVIFLVFFLAWIFPIFFPYFRYALWLFSGSYYRAYSFFIAFTFMYYSLLALELIVRGKKVNPIVLLITVAILFILLNYPFFKLEELQFHSHKAVGKSLYGFVSIMLPLYAAILLMMNKRTINWSKYVFITVLIFELTYGAHISVNHLNALPAIDLSQKRGYNDCTTDAMNYINQGDKTFFRIDKTYYSSPTWFPSINDAMVQGYHGTSSYASFNQQYYVFYLQQTGIIDKSREDESRWAAGLLNRPILESENRVKYILSKDAMNPSWRPSYDSVTTVCDLHIFRNKFMLPFGYTYDSYIDDSAFSKLSKEQKDRVSLQACVLANDDAGRRAGLKKFSLSDTISASIFDSSRQRKLMRVLAEDSLVVNTFKETLIRGTINVSRDEVMYLSVPYDKGWTLYVDNAKTERLLLSGGMTGVPLKKGEHEVVLTYKLRFFNPGLILSGIGILFYSVLVFFAVKRRK
jgi:hypothetical protein